MAYQPSFPGQGITSTWIYDELQRIAAAIEKAHTLQLDTLSAPITRPQMNTVFYADGVNWDPGCGAGLYYFDGAYNKLAVACSTIVTDPTNTGRVLFTGGVAAITQAITLTPGFMEVLGVDGAINDVVTELTPDQIFMNGVRTGFTVQVAGTAGVITVTGVQAALATTVQAGMNPMFIAGVQAEISPAWSSTPDTWDTITGAWGTF